MNLQTFKTKPVIRFTYWAQNISIFISYKKKSLTDGAQLIFELCKY